MVRRTSQTRVEFQNNRYVRHNPGSTTIVEADQNEVRWATKTYISSGFIDWCAEGRKADRRAPLGSGMCYQKVGEIPLALAFDKIPPDAWGDWNAWRKILNDRDYRAFNTYSDHRRV